MKPIKGKFGYLQGVCDRCGEDDLPLIRFNSQVVCDTCIMLIDRSEKSKKTIKQTDADTEFIDRALHE